MKIDVFAVCYNEEIILPYFLRHYRQFASNITIFDNMSTDSSVGIMKEANVNIIPFDTDGRFEEASLIQIRNNCWKKSDADWVIICDIDEFVYHPDIIGILKNTGANHIVTEGYEMMSEVLPIGEGHIYDEIKNGYFKAAYSKPCLFKPKSIAESNFAPGSHTANPTGRNVISVNDTDIKLLHYKYINRKVLIDKYAHYKIRQSPHMIANEWGNYQEWGPDELNKQFDDWLVISENVID